MLHVVCLYWCYFILNYAKLLKLKDLKCFAIISKSSNELKRLKN